MTTGAQAAPQGKHRAAADDHETTIPQHAVGDPGRAPSRVRPRVDGRFPFRPSVVADQVRIPAAGGLDLELRAASVRGLAHRYYGTNRQDSYGFLVSDDNNWLVLAVADGVSAGERSHLAADLAAHRGCELLVEQLAAGGLDWPELLRTLAAEILDIGHEVLGDVDAADVADNLATTALFAVIGLRDELPTEVYAYGDSSAWLLRPGPDGGWTPLQAVKNAEATIASSATRALPVLPPSGEFGEPVSVTLRADAVLVLMSDGVGDPLGSGAGEVGDFLAQMWAEPPNSYSFAAQVDFARRTFDDDRTAIAIWRAG